MTRVFNKTSVKGKRRNLRKQMPKAELLLWKHLRGKQLAGYGFRRQYSVDKYILDFYCPQIRLAIEVDGGSHFSDEAIDYDSKRQKYIESLGIKFLRFTNLDIFESLDSVIQKSSEELPPPTPPCKGGE